MIPKTYGQDLLEFHKFKNGSETLDKDDICIMLDKTCKETGQNQLCRVVKRLSDRTFVVEYNQKLYKLCPKTFKVIRGAKKFQVNRPIQNLVLVTRGGQVTDDVNIDPYVGNEAYSPMDVVDGFVADTEEISDGDSASCVAILVLLHVGAGSSLDPEK